MADVTRDKDRTGQALKRRTHPRPFLPASEEWLDSLRDAGKSAITIESYDRDLDDVAAAVGLDCSSHVRIAEFGQATIDALVIGWETAGASGSTMLRHLSPEPGGSHDDRPPRLREEAVMIAATEIPLKRFESFRARGGQR
jgi:hypothetical protein